MENDLQKLREDLRAMETRVREALPDIAIIITLSAKAISERHIKDQGFGVMYSTSKVPAWFLKGKERNAVGEKFIESKIKAGEETNWQELRAAQGLQTGFVDLSYENEMWRNMQPAPPEVNGDVVTAPLAATNREAQNKMNWNRDRYGDFIGKSLTQEDYKNLGDIVITELLNVMKNE